MVLTIVRDVLFLDVSIYAYIAFAKYVKYQITRKSCVSYGFSLRIGRSILVQVHCLPIRFIFDAEMIVLFEYYYRDKKN